VANAQRGEEESGAPNAVANAQRGEEESGAPNAVAASPDGYTIATRGGGEDASVTLWDLRKFGFNP
ncbi:hypothetical protein T484DRAFT_1839321, partial [Baffinella frigidus]